MTAYKYRFSTGDIVGARDNSIFLCVKKIRLLDGPFSTRHYTGESWIVVNLKNMEKMSLFISTAIQRAYEMQVLNRKENPELGTL